MDDLQKRFRDPEAVRRLAASLKSIKTRPLAFMEVCGTHTVSIFRYGIRDILPENIRLVSGPGCPVCVTPVSFIDAAVETASKPGVIITTFGDLMKVPGSGAGSLSSAKAEGSDIRIVYTPLDCLEIARQNPDKKVVFISVGFETTTPVIALAVQKAYEEGLNNFSVLPANKTMPEALRLLSEDKSAKIDGFLYPGHVSAITGTAMFEEIAGKYGIPGVVTGFEPLDIMHSIMTLAALADKNEARVVNEYSRIVRKEGNPLAVGALNEIFEPCDSIWRGLGNIPGSGLKLREKYAAHDAWRVFGLTPKTGEEPKGCRCGEVLKGSVIPRQCALFGRACTPESPVGACMVSSEGTCAAYYRYGRE